jgi:hypothetical protein
MVERVLSLVTQNCRNLDEFYLQTWIAHTNNDMKVNRSCESSSQSSENIDISQFQQDLSNDGTYLLDDL